MEIIFFTGKGGVGKSTLACATALAKSETSNTLLFSLDLAHNIRDIIGEGRKRNLRVVEAEPHDELDKRWSSIRRFYKGFTLEKGLSEMESEEFLLIPGLEDLLLLLALYDHIEDDYDTVVIDGPPTASTLRLLSIPSSIEWFMEKTFRKMIKRYLRVRRILEKYFETSLPGEDVIEEVEDGYKKILTLSRILKDSETTSFRLVALPTTIALKETGRLFTTLSLFEYPSDMLIINRTEGNSEKILKVFKDTFSFIEVKSIRDYKFEPKGKFLSSITKELKEKDAIDRSPARSKELLLKEKNGKTVLELYTPFMSSDEINIWVSEEGIIIKAGSFKRMIPLKDALNMRVEKAVFKDRKIEVILKYER